jgi:V/A-type H+/Na+-transporting ATPase subunit A
MDDMTEGRVTRVVGPLVELDGGASLAMSDVVRLGPSELPGEVVAIRDGSATVQAYEYTGGLRPGDSAYSLGEPLSVPLGPGLLGGVFDGLLRPLVGAPAWLAPGTTSQRGQEREWDWRARVQTGDQVGPGDCLGVIGAAGAVEHRVLVPPRLSGAVTAVRKGACPSHGAVASVAGVDVSLRTSWPVRRPRPARERLEESAALTTGQRVLDLLFPVARGSAAAVPGGFGTGKTVLLQQLAKWCDADVIVYVGCGERGNEMAEVVEDLGELDDPRTGGRLADRTVVIANTSNMPMMAREASIYTGVAVAEYYRDMGYHAVVIADSTSRWAEALREFGARSGVLPTEEGYPADLPSALAAFYARAGAVTTLGGSAGSVTVVGAVSPPGGDLTEPVTAHTQRFVRCMWSLDRDLAYARHYPAISWSGSFSRDAASLAAWHAHRHDTGWAACRARVVALLAEADRLRALAELVGTGALPAHERVTLLAGRLVREAVLQQSATSANDATCSLSKTAALADGVLAVADRARQVVDGGGPIEKMEQVDFTPLLRARDETGPEDSEGVRSAIATTLDRVAGAA